jgi:hypothetical protein
MTRSNDPNNAASQDQVKRDHDALEESARRVEASVPSNQQPATDSRNAAKQDQVRADHDALADSARRVESSASQPTTDPDAAAKQDRVRADHDRLEESARRVEASVPADVRNTPVQPAQANEDDARDRR